jgi:hypothetical protein
LAAALLARAERLDPQVEERLAAARAAAVQAAAEARQIAPDLVLAGSAGKSQRGGSRRWTLALPAALLVAGLLALQHSQWLQQTLGLADRDAALLKDDLPPNAYGDPGFNEYLDEKPKEETPPPDEDEAKR